MLANEKLLLVMVKMALADGVLSEAEVDFLSPYTEGNLDLLVQKARDINLPDLVKGLDSYPDRFFVAMRAACMALVDGHLDARERDLYERLLKLLEITPEDRVLIDESVDAIRGCPDEPPAARIQELYLQSSFA